jgi:hypothetical protein
MRHTNKSALAAPLENYGKLCRKGKKKSVLEER